MSNHERFKELSAIAAIGLLSSNEVGELNEHLRDCQICREIHDDVFSPRPASLTTG